MALVTKIQQGFKNRYSQQKATECTYFIVLDDHGEKNLQLETDGSKERKMRGKVSQTIRFSPTAIKELKEILSQF